MYGEIFYGCHWRIEQENRDEAEGILRDALSADDTAEFDDMVDSLCSQYGANVTYQEDGTRTIWFGVGLLNVSSAENEFDEMGLLKVMDLKHGTLHKDTREEMTRIMDKIPVSLRDHLSPPRFSVSWGD